MTIEPIGDTGWHMAYTMWNGHLMVQYGKSNLEALHRLFVDLTF